MYLHSPFCNHAFSTTPSLWFTPPSLCAQPMLRRQCNAPTCAIPANRHLSATTASGLALAAMHTRTEHRHVRSREAARARARARARRDTAQHDTTRGETRQGETRRGEMRRGEAQRRGATPLHGRDQDPGLGEWRAHTRAYVSHSTTRCMRARLSSRAGASVAPSSRGS